MFAAYFGFTIYRILRTSEKMRELEQHQRNASISGVSGEYGTC